MQKSNHFSRSKAMATAIRVAVADFGANSIGLQQALHAILGRKEFQSRGHGRRKRSGVNVKVLNKMRRHDTKALPRNGSVKENTPKIAVSTPRRLWAAATKHGDVAAFGFTTRRAAAALYGFAVLQ